MFNFISYTQEDAKGNTCTTALLCDENKQPIEGAGYMTFFAASERRTRINCQIFAGEEMKRLTVCTHVHNEKKIGAAASQFDDLTPILW